MNTPDVAQREERLFILLKLYKKKCRRLQVRILSSGQSLFGLPNF